RTVEKILVEAVKDKPVQWFKGDAYICKVTGLYPEIVHHGGAGLHRLYRNFEVLMWKSALREGMVIAHHPFLVSTVRKRNERVYAVDGLVVKFNQPSLFRGRMKCYRKLYP